MSSTSPQVIVVGAGIAGLVAGVEACRRGMDPIVMDGSGRAGGLAHTTRRGEFARNLGPHAVYDAGILSETLQEFGVGVPGQGPDLTRSQVLHDAAGGTLSSESLLSAPIGELLDHPPSSGATVDRWLADLPLDDRQRSLARTLLRTVTYANAPRLQDAASARLQLEIAVHGVTYVDRGWGTLVDGLRATFLEQGGRLRIGVPVASVCHDSHGVAGVVLADGTEHDADGVIVAVGGPAKAGALLHGPVGQRLLDRRDVPVRMASLDVALDRWPQEWPAQVFGAGDDPRYWLEQSRFVDLAPKDGGVVHVARYLAPGETADRTTRADLETLFDTVRPGWRRHVRHARFLPNLTVSHALPLAASGGLAGRAPVAPGVRGLALAGDGFGAVGQLADAAAASAREAVRTVVADLDTASTRAPTPPLQHQSAM